MAQTRSRYKGGRIGEDEPTSAKAGKEGGGCRGGGVESGSARVLVVAMPAIQARRRLTLSQLELLELLHTLIVDCDTGGLEAVRGSSR